MRAYTLRELTYYTVVYKSYILRIPIGATIRVRGIIIFYNNIHDIPSSSWYNLQNVPMRYIYARAVASITNDFRGRRRTVENRRI